MPLLPLTQDERIALKDTLEEIWYILRKPPFEANHLEDLAKWLRIPGESWPSKGLVWVGLHPENASGPSRRFFRRVNKLHHAILHNWVRDGITILRFADEERVVAVTHFDPYDPSPLQTRGDLRAPGDVLFLDGNHNNAPKIVLIMGRPDKVIHCAICGGALYQTTWNRKYHSGECREIAKKRRDAARD